jgi:hypothetical protein
MSFKSITARIARKDQHRPTKKRPRREVSKQIDRVVQAELDRNDGVSKQSDLLRRAMSPKPRRLSASDKAEINRAAQEMLGLEIEELEQRAHRLGMRVTARALNQAKNALGWERAGNILAAGKAARGGRPK